MRKKGLACPKIHMAELLSWNDGKFPPRMGGKIGICTMKKRRGKASSSSLQWFLELFKALMVLKQLIPPEEESWKWILKTGSPDKNVIPFLKLT